MIRACWAVFYHSISQHHCCPEGPGSWCKFQKAKAMKVAPLPHLSDNDSKRLIPVRLAKHVKSIFERPCSRKLLARCVLWVTQNQNESFNNIMWNKCPKATFCSYLSVQVALNLAVLQFNRGAMSFVSIVERMKIPLDSRSIRYFREKDVFRINRAEKRQQAVEKKRMEAVKRRKAAAQRQSTASEGRTYQAGGF